MHKQHQFQESSETLDFNKPVIKDVFLLRVIIFQHISSNLEHKTSLFVRKDFVVFPSPKIRYFVHSAWNA